VTDVTIVIPTLWDYVAEIVTSISFWGAVCVMSVITIGGVRYYRRKKGWLN